MTTNRLEMLYEGIQQRSALPLVLSIAATTLETSAKQDSDEPEPAYPATVPIQHVSMRTEVRCGARS